MHFKKLAIAATLLSGFLVASVACADLKYQNDTDRVVEIASVFTFGDRTYVKCWYRINPGDTVQIDAGDFNTSRDYYVVSKYLDNGIPLFANNGQITERPDLHFKYTNAWIPNEGMDWQSDANPFLAGRTKAEDFDALLNTLQKPSNKYNALRFGSKIGHKNAILFVGPGGFELKAN